MNQLARIISALMAQGMTRDEAIAHMSGRYFIADEKSEAGRRHLTEPKGDL
jgi:uncharacterized protein YoaH (UPF0181 family)